MFSISQKCPVVQKRSGILEKANGCSPCWPSRMQGNGQDSPQPPLMEEYLEGTAKGQEPKKHIDQRPGSSGKNTWRDSSPGKYFKGI